MLRHYLITAFRRLLRNKVTATIHITGLALGIFSCLCIWLYVADEWSYDKHQSKGNRIYRLNTRIQHGDNADYFALTAFGTPTALADNLTDIEAVVRMFAVGSQRVRLADDKEEYLEEVFFTDTTFFHVFDAQFVYGNSRAALMAPNSAVLTKPLAEKLFGKNNPVGQVLRFTKNSYTVTAVVNPDAYNSNIKYNALLSMNTLDKPTQDAIAGTDWYRMSTYSYILLKEGVTPKMFDEKSKVFIKENIEPWIKQNELQSSLSMPIQPLKDLRFSTETQYDPVQKTNIAYLYIFTLTGIFILLIACFNYINLSTASAAQRAKEVAVRKVSGAIQGQLVKQFLGESLLLSVLALICSLLLLEIFLPYFNALAGKNFNIKQIFDAGLVAVAIALIASVSLLGGLYPAFVLSRFNPITALRSNRVPSTGSAWLRKGLVITQFSLSVIMIVATLIIYRQLQYMRNKDVGFQKQNIAVINFPFGAQDTVLLSKVASLQSEIKRIPGVKNTSIASHIPGKNMGRLLHFVETPSGKSEEREMYCLFADYDFLKLMNVPLIQGRYFDRNITTDAKGAFILNEAAVKYLGWQEPVGKTIENGLEYRGPVVGVVKNFNYSSLHNPIDPLVIMVSSQGAPYNYILAELDGANTAAQLSEIQKVWKGFFMNEPFSYAFMEENIKSLYTAEDKMFRIFCYFSVVAIFISCMGVFGLAMFVTQQRTKEIGIRKVMGATEADILLLINRDFIRLVLIAVIIACPVAWWAMHNWLQKFAYRTELSVAIIIVAAVTALLLAFITVSTQALRAASANPVQSLRYE